MSRALPLVDLARPLARMHDSPTLVDPTAAPRFGRLVPLPGVARRSDPDRRQLNRFLRELRLPLAAAQSLLELVDDSCLPAGAQLAVRAITEHHEYLLQLLADYAELGQLEQGAVALAPQRVDFASWLDESQREWHLAAERAGQPLRVDCRSFLPSHVLVDGELLRRSVLRVLRVVLARALRDEIVVRLAYVHGRAVAGPGCLVIELQAHGGGFAELEQGYVFTPFFVRDGADRPLLGLTLAERQADLLGGHLQVGGGGRAAARCRLEVPAPATADAQWFDPLVGRSRLLGPVCPGRVLFAGCPEDARTLCQPLLQRGGFTLVDAAAEPERLEALLAEGSAGWSAVVFAHQATFAACAVAIARARRAGFVGACIVVGTAPSSHGDAVVGIDELSGRALLAVLGSGRGTGHAAAGSPTGNAP